MQDGLSTERMLEHMISGSETGLGVTAPQMEIERDIGIRLALQMLEIGKGPRRLEYIVHDRPGGHRLDFVEHRRQFLIVSDDELRRRVGHVGIARQYHSHRLADIVHFFGGKDRLVVEGGAVEWIRNDGADIVDCDYPMHTLDRLRRTHIKVGDAPVRDRAAEKLAVKHARQPYIMHVFGAAGDLRLAFKTE